MRWRLGSAEEDPLYHTVVPGTRGDSENDASGDIPDQIDALIETGGQRLAVEHVARCIQHVDRLPAARRIPVEAVQRHLVLVRVVNIRVDQERTRGVPRRSKAIGRIWSLQRAHVCRRTGPYISRCAGGGGRSVSWIFEAVSDHVITFRTVTRAPVPLRRRVRPEERS